MRISMMIPFLATILSVKSRNCSLKETHQFDSTDALKSWYLDVLGKRYNEPKKPFDETLQDRLFGNQSCGQPVIDVTRAIINGQDAPSKAWPLQALLMPSYNVNTYPNCGGSLISSSWVITAAHCFEGNQYKYYVVLGARDLRSFWEPSRKKLGVQKFILHEGYDSKYNYADIALIKLKEEISFDEYVSPICLPKLKENIVNDDICYVTGWGRHNISDYLISMVLQQLRVKFMPQSLCAYTWGIGRRTRITQDKICLDLNDDYAGLCHGDSGGPLACKIGGRFVLTGITSFTHRSCNYKVLPSVSTRLTEYMDWVLKTVAEYDG